MAFEVEQLAYARARAWLTPRHEGRWAVVSGRNVRVRDTYDDALSFGYQTYGLEPFMVRQIWKVDPVMYFNGPV